MKKELEKEFYDEVYSSGGSNKMYFKKYTESPYYFTWKIALSFLKEKSLSVLDIGCGPGQFAEMLFDSGIKNYIGFDFSKQAIEMAKKTNLENSEKFFVEDIFKTDIFNNEFDVYFCFEVLEHIDNDLGVFDKVPSGKEMICSVPNYNSKGHVRVFKSAQKVVDRYSKVLNITNVIPVNISANGNTIYVFRGTKV